MHPEIKSDLIEDCINLNTIHMIILDEFKVTLFVALDFSLHPFVP